MRQVKERIITYEPDNSLKKGYWSMFGKIFEEIRENRWLTYQLFKRDFLTMYKQSFIGILWAFIIPVVSVGTFIVLNRSGVFTIGTINVPYPVYAMLGICFWQLFSTGLIASSNSLVNAGPMIVKINFSKKSLVLASAGQAIVSFLIQFSVVGILFFYYGITPSIAVLLVPILIIPLVLFTLGLGFMLSLLNGVFRDIGNIISILLTFLMFLTPVLYSKPNEGILQYITDYNPLYYLIAVPRDIILTGNFTDWRSFLFTGIFSLVAAALCIMVFHLTETRVAERI